MRFLNWLKSLFSKNTQSAPKESSKWDPYWSEILRRLIYHNLEYFDKASDIKIIRKDWVSLSNSQKVQVMQEFFKSLAYYESGYDPKCESVDVTHDYPYQMKHSLLPILLIQMQLIPIVLVSYRSSFLLLLHDLIVTVCLFYFPSTTRTEFWDYANWSSTSAVVNVEIKTESTN